MTSRALLGRSSRRRFTFRSGFLFDLAQFMRKPPPARSRLILGAKEKLI
jgi:hypothetical protein